MAKAASPIRSLPARSDFLRLAKLGHKYVTPTMIMQVEYPSSMNAVSSPIWLGLTATKKIGNAVLRNRARRRLRALARQAIGDYLPSGSKIVLIATTKTAQAPFETLAADLKKGLSALEGKRP